MLSVFLAAIVNFVGDLLLCSGLGLGIVGAAYSTIFSQYCACALLMSVLWRRGSLDFSPVTSALFCQVSKVLRFFGLQPPIPVTGPVHSAGVSASRATDSREGSSELTELISTARSVLSFFPFLFVMVMKMTMHNSVASAAAVLGGTVKTKLH